jgi:hypothetical protein
MNEKGFVSLVIIIIFVAAAVLGGGVWYYNESHITAQPNTKIELPLPPPETSPSTLIEFSSSTNATHDSISKVQPPPIPKVLPPPTKMLLSPTLKSDIKEGPVASQNSTNTFSANIDENIESSIDGDYNGWTGETIYKLLNGQYWMQTQYYYHYKYKYAPEVLIYKSGSSYKMHVREDDSAKDIGVRQLSDVIESRIDGEYKGWEGNTIYKLRNGQIWQQSSYHYHYHYAYSPEVLIYNDSGFKMKVVGDDDQAIGVVRLK